jgi:hypothetical protein
MLVASMRAHGFVAFAFVFAVATAARAEAPDVDRARDAFREGAALARDAQWGAALAAFEKSAKLKPHPWTTYNIAVCERALGQYVRARRTFTRALDERKTDADLPEATVGDIKRFQQEIAGLVGTLDVDLDPADAAVAVDGQPLEPTGDGGDTPTLLAGTLPAGPGKAPPAAHFRVVLDPGAHVFVISRAGFTDAVHAETIRPGEKRAIALAVTRLPANLDVSANQNEAVVTVNKLDVGIAPVSLLRPAGSYHVVVRRSGFRPYEVDTVLEPGQKTEIKAKLEEEKPSILTRWWFWTAAGIVVVGAAATTYLVTRPSPERPPLEGGGLGWTAKAP